VGVDGEPHHPQALLQVVLPDRLVPLHQFLAAPDVVHQDVEPALLGADLLDEGRDLVWDQMIYLNRHAGPARSGD
jgi:hypothetical protein